ncbi:hexokinase-1-like isoform X2 [Apostichopus japonicus]|uniref:Phosphotransferase n=1 Tax=Stichopus japonicus TaxID=307972 RepID=A0A0P0H429_STIJA|nr:hexokinase [Apostichopus japonicus]
MASRVEQVDSVLDALHLNLDALQDIQGRMHSDMVKGLGAASNKAAVVKMFPTYVRSLPDGSENGDFFALDLGGSNFRVLLVKLRDGNVEMKSKVYKIATEIMTGTGENLFNYIADCLAEFKKEQGLEGKDLPLGFTFSFPCRQNGLNSASLVTWTKGFSATGVVDQDVAKLLSEACKRRNVNLDIIAVVNDTTGTLMSCAHADSNCYVGLIIGTGTNACYMEALDEVELWNGDKGEPKQTIINMEWGAFGDDGSIEDIRTDFDRELDKITLNQGKQLYEKMISGMYLGEISRQAILKLAKEKLLFNGVVSAELQKPWAFESKFLTDIEKDVSTDGLVCREILRQLNCRDTMEDVTVVRAICSAVSTRAAKLVTAGLAAVIKKMGRKTLTIGVDGSLYKYHPRFHPLMDTFTRELVPEARVKYMLSEDGSGKGAALIAAVAVRLTGK